DVIDGGQARAAIGGLAGILELDLPDAAERAGRIEEIDQAAADAAHRRDVEFARPDRLAEWRIEQQGGPLERRRGVVYLEAERTHRRAMDEMEGMGEALLLAIHHEIDVALVPARHRLRPMLAGPPES